MKLMNISQRIESLSMVEMLPSDERSLYGLAMRNIKEKPTNGET